MTTRLLITQSDILPDDPKPRTVFRLPVRCSLFKADGALQSANYTWLLLPNELPLPWGVSGPVTLALSTLDGKHYSFELSAHVGEIDISDRTDVRLTFNGWEHPVVLSYSGYLV